MPSPPTSLIHNVSEISSVIDSNLCLENDGDASQNDIVASLSSENSFVLPQGVSPPAPPVNGAPIDPANIVQHPRVRRSTAPVSSSPNNPNLALLVTVAGRKLDIIPENTQINDELKDA